MFSQKLNLGVKVNILLYLYLNFMMKTLLFTNILTNKTVFNIGTTNPESTGTRVGAA